MSTTLTAPAGASLNEDAQCLCGGRKFTLIRDGRFGFFPVDGQPVPFSVLACHHCGLAVTSPRPGSHIAYCSHDPLRDKAEEDDSPMLVATSQHRLAKIRARIGIPARALEVGCSTGALVGLLAGAGTRESVGVELHAPAVAGALRRGRDVRGLPLQDCGFADGHFDFVQAHHVLEHVPDLHGLLQDMVRVLRPGGHAFFTVPCLLSPLARSDDWQGWFPQEHFWHFTPDTLLPLLARHGLGRFRTSRPLQTDFVRGPGVAGALKSMARSAVRVLGLGDTLEVWAVRQATPAARGACAAASG